MNAPFTFHRMMDKLLGLVSFVHVYLGNVMILSPDLSVQVRHIKEVINLVS